MITGPTTAAAEVAKIMAELAFEDPYDSPEYQEYVAKVAETCDADDKPCDSCLAGGMCDGPSEEREDPPSLSDWESHYLDL